jgi:hypothetical protein
LDHTQRLNQQDTCLSPLKITVDGIDYDTDRAEKLAHKPTCSSDQQLFRMPNGNFFLLILQMHVDGLKLGPNEVWIDLGRKSPRKTRLCITARILPLSARRAVEWCIKTQIPTTFRGYLLESI